MRVQDKLIDSFFELISNEILPSFIMSENKNIHNEIDIIQKMFIQARDDIKKIEPEQGNTFLGSDFFKTEFKTKMIEITKYIKERTEEPHCVYELGSALGHVSDLIDQTSTSIMLKAYDQHNALEILEKTPKKKIHPIINGLEFLKTKFLPVSHDDSASNIKEDMWEELAKESISRLIKDFDLRSVSIMGKQPWSEVYSWANDTHRAITDAQENIGLSQKSAGINKTLNISYSPDSLFYRAASGTMLPHEISNTITLTQQPYEIQKGTWQHEYTHALDNRSCIQYLKEVSGSNSGKGFENLFLSHLEIAKTLLDSKLLPSKNLHTQQAQIWTSEALSMILNGKNTDAFKNYQKEAENNFLNDMSKYLVISFLPDQEKSWMNLSTNTQKEILNDRRIKDFTKYISINLYKKGDNFLSEIFTEKNENLSKLKEELQSVASLICFISREDEATFLSQTLKTIEKNKVCFSKDLKAYLNKHSYSFDDYSTYFPTSESIKYASVEALENNKNYWIRPIEILARASENLQEPLIIGTQEFHDKNESYLKSQLVPKLNKEERILLINSIQSMARSIGLEVIKEPEDVKAVEKQLNYIEENNFSNISIENLKTYSTATGNESASQILLNMAKLRASNQGLTKNKP